MPQHTLSKRRLRDQLQSARNRQELIAAGFTRRDLVKMGLVTSAGLLVEKNGLSARARNSAGEATGQTTSPEIVPFSEPLPVLFGPDAAPNRMHTFSVSPSVFTVGGPPTQNPQTGEGRRKPHQLFPPASDTSLRYIQTIQAPALVKVSEGLPEQPLWTFNGVSPGPTFVAHYGEQLLVRNVNNLPAQNGGFGIPSVSTHLHNGHTPSESDGNPLDYFESGQFYDQHYPNVLAGCESTHIDTRGDLRESMSTLWYHDHRVDFTAQNVYKGLAGFYLLFNEFDCNDDARGFHLPCDKFDVPLMFSDKVFDPSTQLLFFDLFNLDGILGDRFLVNGKIQPFFEVQPRRYRLRLLNSGPSRFYQFHLTDPTDLTARHPFWHIANDGNLLPKPVQVNNIRLSVAERMDIIVDFSRFAGKRIYLENRLEQTDGRKPDDVVAAGQGSYVLRFDVGATPVNDTSQDPATVTKYYDTPDGRDSNGRLIITEAPIVTRRFRFERGNGMWQVNGRFMDSRRDAPPRFRVKRNSVERWILQNNSGGWDHPIHIHFEEFQVLNRNGNPPRPGERGRKDVAWLHGNEEIAIYFRFRDFRGSYPIHCHNVVHEDHAMMLLFEIDDVGDLKERP